MLDDSVSADTYKSLVSTLSRARVKEVNYDNIVVDLDNNQVTQR